MKYIVMGLGEYGASLGSKLVELGHEVFGIDINSDRAEKWKNRITYTITMDASNRQAIQDLPLKEADAVIVAIGENEGTIILVAALLKQLGVKRIICRVTSTLQKTVLETMTLSEFVYPEQNSAERMAFKLTSMTVIDSYRVCGEYQIIEANVPMQLIDKKVNEVNLIEEYDVQLITIKRQVEERNILGQMRTTKKTIGVLPSNQDTIFKNGDSLVIFGKSHKLTEFLEH